MDDSVSVPLVATFKDRSGGLIGFGILVILVGCLCALFIPLLFLGQAMSARTTGAPDYRMIAPALVMYGGLAIAFVWLGIGSILARRWARALLLILAWAWLVMGVVMLGFMAFFLPHIFSNPPPGGQPLPAGALVVAMIVALGIVGVMFILLPGLLVLFYGSRHVKATCENRDPVVRWTDACPLPVLALSLLLAFGALSMVPMLFVYHRVVPCFGFLVSGGWGTAAFLGFIVVWSYCAWAIYRLHPAGWWTILVAFILVMVSSLLTFARVDFIELYRQMGYPEQQISQIQQSGFFTGHHLLILMALGMVPFFGYALYVKRYFRRV